MYKLYIYETCPYCQKVIAAFNEMGVKYETIIADRGTAGSEELISLGGMQQVPFLVDEDRNVKMYESNDIIEYAKKHFSQN